MKNLKLFIILGGLSFCLSCGEGDCTQADWIGVYTLNEASVNDLCQGFFPDELVITEEIEGAISINGLRWDLRDCKVGEAVLGAGIQYSLMGSSIESIQANCTATYRRS